MSNNSFYRMIQGRVKDILEENKQLMAAGKLHKVQCNCNMLRGIDFVIQRLRHFESD